ncbi:MAG: glycine cleavage system protein GcvH [Jiangellales bacterium]
MVPDDRRYTAQHEWVLPTEVPGRVRVGITDFAQEQLGDVVYVSLPDVGAQLGVEATFGEVESTKSVSDLYAPLEGTVVARNDDLDAAPELVNTDPYGAGWMIELELSDAALLESLLDAEGYRAQTG